jgi:hypothetical protein
VQISELVEKETKAYHEFIEMVIAHGESLRLRDSEEYKNSKLFASGNF